MTAESRTTLPPELSFDVDAELERLSSWIRTGVRALRRRGTVLGVSGGVDSAVCAVLAARAVGPERVHALLMPERDSDPAGTERGRRLCESLGIPWTLEDITPTLDALGCYHSRNGAVRTLFPDFTERQRMKISVSGSPLAGDGLNSFDLTVEDDHGELRTHRMPAPVYRTIVAATNMKQRTRKLLEYRQAEALNHAVLGTCNRLEYELGFFVRGGDGLADLKPIAHLYKMQVYALAEALDIPEEILTEPPSTDTFSLPQTQEEFYFAMPLETMDRALRAWHEGLSPETAGARLGLTSTAMARIYGDIEAKLQVGDVGRRPALVPSPSSFGAPEEET